MENPTIIALIPVPIDVEKLIADFENIFEENDDKKKNNLEEEKPKRYGIRLLEEPEFWKSTIKGIVFDMTGYQLSDMSETVPCESKGLAADVVGTLLPYAKSEIVELLKKSPRER